MLDHARHQNFHKCICGSVEVAEHDIVAPPPNESDCVGVNSFPGNAMVTTANIESGLNLVGLKATCGTEILTAYRSALVISVIMIADHFPFLDTTSSGVRMLTLCLRRCETRLLTAGTAHTRGCQVSTRPIESPLMTFLCLARRRLKSLQSHRCKELQCDK